MQLQHEVKTDVPSSVLALLRLAPNHSWPVCMYAAVLLALLRGPGMGWVIKTVRVFPCHSG